MCTTPAFFKVETGGEPADVSRDMRQFAILSVVSTPAY
jgi:hypothetical protein